MLAKIEEDSPKTNKFWKYILEGFLGRSPLRKGKIIEIKIEEGITPLPEFTEIPEPSPIGDTRGIQIAAKEERGQRNFNILWNYLRDKLAGMCDSPQADDLKWSPLKATISFIVHNPQKIYREARKRGITIPEAIEQNTRKKSSKPRFLENPPRIIWGDKIISIPIASIELCLVRAAFRKLPGQTISWDEIADEIDAPTDKKLKSTRRRIYDAFRRINKKVKREAGRELFKWSSLSFFMVA